jgi:crotonobetainyl-CoA:carnitine CoA-transferase CaiB-like acyl-CoA transferase
MAFHCQRETGLGQHVDISIMETLTGVLQYLPVEYAWTGGVKTRTPRGGTGSSFSVPCKNGDVVPVLIGMNLELLGSFLNLPPEGSEALGKIAWRDTRAVAGQVVPLMAKAFEQRGKQELLFSSQEWRFPWTVVQDARDIANCPHLKDRNFFVELNQPGMGKVKLPGAPFVMTETPFQAQPAPLLGEHNEEVYVKHLGYSKEDMVKLREMGAI